MNNDSVATAYTTVDGQYVHELEIKRSRFITYLRRVESEGQARALVAELRKKHFDARHHCSAFILGADRTAMRSNDDGEPSGTAGIPMLDALAKRETASGSADLSDIAAVVVRYFGGILLGAGGLVRAYSESVSSTLEAAPLLRRERLRILGVEADYAAAGRLENDLRSAGVQVLGTDYGDSAATLRVALNDDATILTGFNDRLATLTAGASHAEDLGTEWVDVR
ncbi:YigZ family protein [Paeniglutamicibacter gangotriensis]|uniref:Xaa-Pro dipeptidase n=2 Tax=Paeniglutamicibacter gangotriensis TaxID=254787 RepID=M7ML29_9MICC|nr:YigZ family protein [Paeniglutamicibacter gangotriensis]EMQ97042.1 Xaa-Pro dipeptidase [Paeniglutamicibacter gangotriensis Lz1y]KAA0979830.1 YigZ family protein [Paeniglutamicibacter gangotriensis]